MPNPAHSAATLVLSAGEHSNVDLRVVSDRRVARNAMKLPRRKFLHLATGAAALPAASRIAWAQAYPTRPVRMIVPFAPGGQTDAIARLVAQKLSEHFDRQFYVENMPGAGGNIGMGRAAQSMPDGYTILVVDGTSF